MIRYHDSFLFSLVAVFTYAGLHAAAAQDAASSGPVTIPTIGVSGSNAGGELNLTVPSSLPAGSISRRWKRRRASKS